MDLSLVRQTAPEWFRAEGLVSADLRGTATIELQGAATPYRIQLRIWVDADGLNVSEAEPSQLPSRCPERHINNDGTFCLGFGLSGLGNGLDGARVWWGLLREYLKHQRTAERTGLWPVRAAISHGKAGVHHIAALEAAKALGVEDAYNRLIEGERCWINDRSVRISKDGSRLVNGRSRCPVGCRGRRQRARLRRECCKAEDVLRLILSEQQRKTAEVEFWSDWQAKGHRCCGTIRVCPAGMSCEGRAN